MRGPIGMPTCRFCRGLQPTEEKGPFVKYGPRHYAHMLCFHEAGKSVNLLRPKQQGELKRWLSKRGH